MSLRYNVICAYATGEQESTYNSVAKRIADGELQQLAPILQAMRGIYVEDKPFHAAFSEKIIRTTNARNNRVVRFIMNCEKYFGKSPEPSLPVYIMYGLRVGRSGDRIPVRRDFPHPSRPALGLTQLPIHSAPGLSRE
jgi:hypothetical protein